MSNLIFNLRIGIYNIQLTKDIKGKIVKNKLYEKLRNDGIHFRFIEFM